MQYVTIWNCNFAFATHSFAKFVAVVNKMSYFHSDVNKATTLKAKATISKAKATTPKAKATYLKAKNTTTFPQHVYGTINVVVQIY